MKKEKKKTGRKQRMKTLNTRRRTTPCISLFLHCWMSAKMAGKKTFEKRACHLQILFLAISLREQRTRIDMDRCLTASSKQNNSNCIKDIPSIHHHFLDLLTKTILLSGRDCIYKCLSMSLGIYLAMKASASIAQLTWFNLEK